MFSGIVRAVGVVEFSRKGQLEISSQLFETREFELGASIAISGVCLTVVAQKKNTIRFDLASETLDKTSLGFLKAGDKVNIEPALCLGEPLDGHMMLGHVDALTELIELSKPDANTVKLVFTIPAGFEALVASKGSVALAGVSLTVGEVTANSFSVYIIPLTWSETVLGDLEVGDKLNFEADCLARYVQRAVEYRTQTSGGEK